MLRVLIVDDQRDSADSLAVLIQLWGHDARSAYAAEHAFTLATSWCPDVLIIDLIMPGENGISLAERLREQPACKDSVFLALTALTGKPIRDVAGEVFSHYLIKPIDPEVLRCRLHTLARTRLSELQHG